jgi:crotonobetainyl-CoA:carnitine CoA-transferase CaiB-like acyl-CoA transferase
VTDMALASDPADLLLRERMAEALQLEPVPVTVTGAATLESPYPVTDFAAASIATAGVALAGLLDALDLGRSTVTVRRELSEGWFVGAVRPVGWEPPPPWDAIAGDYLASDGWIRLHTNAPAHRAAALRVLGVEAVRESVARAVAAWQAEALESAIVDAGGCAAMMRSPADWAKHPQGAAVAAEPLVARKKTDQADDSFSRWRATRERPLAGLRVLDLTRVLAGPVSTRLLAGLGADVLRVDPPDWEEPALVPDMTLGKRSARLDASTPDGLGALIELLRSTDVIVHGYRPEALEQLGLGEKVRRETRPGLVDVSLDAYGHTGPWAGRRGFDSLVQMSSGIAEAGMRAIAAEVPTPLPVQALDHATGYLAAAAVLTGLAVRVRKGRGWRGRLSLARTALELENARGLPRASHFLDEAELPADPIATPWGRALLLHPPLELGGVTVRWEHAPRNLGADEAAW